MYIHIYIYIYKCRSEPVGLSLSAPRAPVLSTWTSQRLPLCHCACILTALIKLQNHVACTAYRHHLMSPLLPPPRLLSRRLRRPHRSARRMPSGWPYVSLSLSKYMFVYIYIYTYMCVYINKYINTYIYIYICTHSNIYIYIYTRI